ncbi:protein-tyrosine-phosphatase [Algoriphagus sp. C2-6-M1]|uniref:protein-tyrosine-phosphatase n=1 Tax=Algoriphagus persicinus TaxID=3108754 RepID=UPI002B3FD88B|nr:protein-tyrosine-phosphatase [Algoriphagus sp. C2-6-M1]MEB2782300.1 protein-tyrosine-phosphatase [Algoriphagus sp. C2-6-M1]
MNNNSVILLPRLAETVEKARSLPITDERKAVLQFLIDYIQEKLRAGEELNLNFICTHNSRRSQFSQIWAQTAADYFGIPADCYSGGVEVTEFNERAVESIKRSGFRVTKKGSENPIYFIFHSDEAEPISAFSKLFNDPINKAQRFAAVMTCAHADKNCPFIPGTENRIPVRYEDPKKYDGTSEEASRYDERSLQIASEMFYVFGQIHIKA